MTPDLNFIAIDFETATGYRHSICEVGLCIVVHGEIIETRSWLVRPPDNFYWDSNIRIHGIHPADTADAPDFSEVWDEIERTYLDHFDTFVAHNATFDRSCLHAAARHYNLHLPHLTWHCTLRLARRVYTFSHNNLGALCTYLNIPLDNHHRAGDDARACAHLYLREIESMRD